MKLKYIYFRVAVFESVIFVLCYVNFISVLFSKPYHRVPLVTAVTQDCRRQRNHIFVQSGYTRKVFFDLPHGSCVPRVAEKKFQIISQVALFQIAIFFSTMFDDLTSWLLAISHTINKAMKAAIKDKILKRTIW